MAIKPIKPVTLGNVAKKAKKPAAKTPAIRRASPFRSQAQLAVQRATMPAVKWKAPKPWPYGKPTTPLSQGLEDPYPEIQTPGEPTYPAPATTPPPAPAPPPPAPAPAAPPPAPVTVGPGGRTYLKWNPQLPAHPLGGYTDAEYLASEAALRTGTISDYQNILRELGYESPEGQFMRGSLEIGAEQGINEQDRLMREAVTNLTNEMRESGTLFSGYRGTEEARRTQPMATEKSEIQTQLGLDLAQRLQTALDILASYPLERDRLLAAAAQRQAEAIEESPVGEAAAETPPATAPPPAAGKKPVKPKPKPRAKKPPPKKRPPPPKKAAPKRRLPKPKGPRFTG